MKHEHITDWKSTWQQGINSVGSQIQHLRREILHLCLGIRYLSCEIRQNFTAQCHCWSSLTHHDSYKCAFKTFPFQRVAVVVFLVIQRCGDVQYLVVVRICTRRLSLFHSWDLVTLRAKPSSTVYCYRSCLCLCVCNGRAGGVCYHDNSKLHASIFTKLGRQVQVVTTSS